MKQDTKTISELLGERQGRALGSTEVCDILGYTKIGLHKLTQKGAIPHHRIGDRIKFDPIVLLRWWENAGVGY